MKKYIVQKWVNFIATESWEFRTMKKSLKFYKAKVENLSKERKKENQKTNGKFEDGDSLGYTWLNKQNTLEVLSYRRYWEEVKYEN